MKQKVLALAGCIAATASSATIADVLPENIVGLNLGEIHSTSFLNQPFKGVIPFLFTSYENSKNLRVTLAPQSVFNEVGAEKHPILNNLHFQITKQNNKPVILISSDKPINLPFLNFILEIKGPETSVYQDYTVLLDPESKQQATASGVEYIDVNESIIGEATTESTFANVNSNANLSDEELLRANGTLLLANLSSEIQSSKKQNLKYRVKAGDSLSKIAKKQNIQNASLKTVSRLIFQKNQRAFIRGNVNRLKKGVVLNLPTAAEVDGFQLAQTKATNIKKSKLNNTKLINNDVVSTTKKTVQNTYTVLKGDNLSKITKKFASKDVSFTKLMNTIYSNNPTAFVNSSKNRLKAGVKLSIPSFDEVTLVSTQKKKETTATAKQSSKKPPIQAKKVSKASEVVLKPNQYQVREGDTLSYVTNKLGYKEVPFAKMLNAIYAHNPNAFADGKKANLLTGSIITLPPLSIIEAAVKTRPAKAKQVSNVKIPKKAKSTEPTKPSIVKSDAVVSTNLTKRIRELRKELHQAKESLSDLKSNLNNKETLLEQKNIQLDSLNTLLTKFESKIDPELLKGAAIKTKANTALIKNDGYKPKSKAEMAKLKRELLIKQEKTKNQLKKVKELQEKTFESTKSLQDGENDGIFKEYKVSSLLNLSNTNYAYLTMVLTLSLLLIRYRRALYSYTYSAINYDQPKYYPIQNADRYELKEKNINFHDPKMDEDPSNYELLTKEKTNNDQILINQHLVEATEDIFEPKYENTDEAKQIEHCEHLVTELFDDLDKEKDKVNDSEWDDIEKVCDTYIDKIKDTETKSDKDPEEALLSGATDFNHMMSDLLESLDKVDKSVKKNNIDETDLPDIVRSANSDIEPNDNHDRI